MPGLRPGRDADDEYAGWPAGPSGRRLVPTDTAELLARQGLTGRGPELPQPRLPSPGPGLREPGAELAEQLKQAWIMAGRPSMSDVGDEVGYSKATISKVLSGKMPPAWQLVRKLGVVLRVSRETVQGEWHPLWIAADNRRRQAAMTPEPRVSELPCARCGSVVAEPRDHDVWHADLDTWHSDVEARHADLQARQTDLEIRYADLIVRHAGLAARQAELEAVVQFPPADNHDWAALRNAVRRREE